MSTNPLSPGIGISFHDDNWHAAVVSMSSARIKRENEPLPLVSRDFSGKMLPNETVGHAVGRILDKYVGHTPSHVGVSTHHENIDSLSWRRYAGTHVEAVDPTAATLMGLEHVKRNPNRLLIRSGSGNSGGDQGLLKIGPDNVTWIVDGETEGTVLKASTIRRFSPAAEDFATGIHATDRTNPVQLLGNLGWVNAARYFDSKGPEFAAEATDDLIKAAKNGGRKSRRELVAHLGWLAPRIEFMSPDPEHQNGEPFAANVANFMLELTGRTIGYVAQQQELSTLYVQCNAISGSESMRRWGTQALVQAIARHDESNPKLSLKPDVILVEPRPQMAEAYGAILLAGQKVEARV